MNNNINQIIAECEMLLVGIGNGFGRHINYDKIPDLEQSLAIFNELENGSYDDTLALYNRLATQILGKNYFIIDTNTDGLIHKSDLNQGRIVAPCGSITRLQCACEGENGIHATADIYNSKEAYCPVCGNGYLPNIHGVNKYNETAYLKQWNLYNKWLCGALNKKLVLLEMGSDFKYASLIRWPFEKVTMIHQKALLIRVNRFFPQGTPEIKDKVVSFQMDEKDFLEKELLTENGGGNVGRK